jgi:cytochrome c-type biogenesis protein CcsB
VSGHAPWSDAYESVIFIAFATMLAGMVFSRKSKFSLAASCVVASMLLFVANINWLSPELTNLVPVLKSYWLMIHVSVITSSYGFFGLCAFIGFLNLILIIPKKEKEIDANIQDLTIINEQSMAIGLFLLTVGTFLGGVWANESWGRYWGWDPKETWALVSIIVYALILHIRLLKSNSYIFFFNFCALFGFGSILMTYFGVNYYLDGLHSYAAGDAFPVPTFVPWTILILGILSIISFIRFKNSIR